MRLLINCWRPADREPCDVPLEILRLDFLGIIPEDNDLYRGKRVALNPESAFGREHQDIVRRLLGEEAPFMTSNS